MQSRRHNVGGAEHRYPSALVRVGFPRWATLHTSRLRPRARIAKAGGLRHFWPVARLKSFRSNGDFLYDDKAMVRFGLEIDFTDIFTSSGSRRGASRPASAWAARNPIPVPLATSAGLPTTLRSRTALFRFPIALGLASRAKPGSTSSCVNWRRF